MPKFKPSGNRNIVKTKRFPNKGPNKPNNLNDRGGIKRRTIGNVNKSVTDARQKIISKKRTNLADARDVLTKIAKTQDARSKLLKLRETRTSGLTGSVRAIGSNILQKTDRNGKISLVTSKNKESKNDINYTIQQELGLVPTPRKKPTPKRTPTTVKRKESLPVVSPRVARKSASNNDFEYQVVRPKRPYTLYSDEYLSGSGLHNLHARIGPVIESPITVRKPQEVYLEDLLSRGYQEYPKFSSSIIQPRLSAPIGYVDLDAPDEITMEVDDELPLRKTIFMQGTSRSSNVHSRLDTTPVQTQSHGIFASPQTKTKVVIPVGHRIVVSNLQQTVTQDDIRELFEDIGQLLVARLVRPGTAEVIYKNLKDAQKAVDTYHNRQLDGQPMKCLLVNKRPLNNPTGPALAPNQPNASFLMLNKKQGPTKLQDKLVPDLQTIHKVLFQRT